MQVIHFPHKYTTRQSGDSGESVRWMASQSSELEDTYGPSWSPGGTDWAAWPIKKSKDQQVFKGEPCMWPYITRRKVKISQYDNVILWYFITIYIPPADINIPLGGWYIFVMIFLKIFYHKGGTIILKISCETHYWKCTYLLNFWGFPSFPLDSSPKRSETKDYN